MSSAARRWRWAGSGALAGFCVAAQFLVACRRASGPEVVVYCAQDQVYAEPLFARFTGETGIRVRPLYDSEAVKTVGLANRLLAERAHPQADVFWGNEELRTRQLAAQDVFQPTNGWVALGYRSRRIVVNTNLVSLPQAPRSLHDLTNHQWRGKVALAYPLFGTTATHFLALRQHWGGPRWEAWCRALAANQPLVVDGNSVAARLVGKGEAWVGLTDSDDIAVVRAEGAPVMALPLDGESLLIPNTLAITRGAAQATSAQALVEWLRRPEVLQLLVATNAIEGASVSAVTTGTLQPDWAKLLTELSAGTATLKEVFLR